MGLNKIIETGKMLKSKGVKYELGAKAVPPNIPTKLDCSGFVRYCFLSAGVFIPDGTYHQFNASLPVDKVRVGDVGFLQLPTQKGINHVGIYVGDGLWMHCNYSRNGITIEKTNMFKYVRRFRGTEEEYDVEKATIVVNGKEKEVDVIMVEGRTFVELRDLESFKIEIGWDPNTKRASINTF